MQTRIIYDTRKLCCTQLLLLVIPITFYFMRYFFVVNYLNSANVDSKVPQYTVCVYDFFLVFHFEMFLSFFLFKHFSFVIFSGEKKKNRTPNYYMKWERVQLKFTTKSRILLFVLFVLFFSFITSFSLEATFIFAIKYSW